MMVEEEGGLVKLWELVQGAKGGARLFFLDDQVDDQVQASGTIVVLPKSNLPSIGDCESGGIVGSHVRNG